MFRGTYLVYFAFNTIPNIIKKMFGFFLVLGGGGGGLIFLSFLASLIFYNTLLDNTTPSNCSEQVKSGSCLNINFATQSCLIYIHVHIFGLLCTSCKQLLVTVGVIGEVVGRGNLS